MNSQPQVPPSARSLERMQYIIRRGSPRFAGALEALRIIKLIDAWEPTAAIVAEAEKSPELAQGIIRLAESPLYAQAQIKDLSTAVEFLGYDELRRVMLTLAISTWSDACEVTGAYDPVAFRRRAVAHAMLSDMIAKHLRFEQPTKFFVAGMFADIGYMFIALHIPYVIDHIALVKSRTPSVSLEESERHCVGFVHADLSAVACREVGLDAEVVEAVRFHHRPSEVQEAFQRVADVIHIASYMLDRVDVLAVKSLPVAPVEEDAYERLGLDRNELSLLDTEVLEKVDVITSAIRTKLAA